MKERYMTEADIMQLLFDIQPALIAQKKIIATAESCTGGWIAKFITDIEGCSQWFDASIVSYSNQSKMDLLAVRKQSLHHQGAVSQLVVKEMAVGLLQCTQANIAVSISGIAGPSGGSADKPVGTVWIAWAIPGQLVESLKFNFKGDRNQVRLQSVFAAFKGIERILTG